MLRYAITHLPYLVTHANILVLQDTRKIMHQVISQNYQILLIKSRMLKIAFYHVINKMSLQPQFSIH